MADRKVWGIHAGRYNEADPIFREKKVIALGWPQMGDLSQLRPDRDAFKKAVASAYPGVKPGVIPNNAGQLFRFVHELQKGDVVVYPSRLDREIYLGIVDGPYEHEPELAYPHTRPVRWMKNFPRTSFSQGALYEIGSALSFFQVRNYADEFTAALAKQPSTPAPQEDETVGAVAGDIEDTTRDYVLKQLSTELKGHPLALFVSNLLEAMGYHTRVSPEGPDGGVDVIAHRDELGFEPPIVKVQVKSGDGAVSDSVVSSLYGKVSASEFGMFVTLSTFTSPARAFARSKTNLRLIDGDELVDLILRHYDNLDASYKSLLPLKRVYVPQALEDE